MSERTVDARGLFCPFPIIELAKAMKEMAPGDRVSLIATDPAVRADLSAWCEATGHALVSLEEREGALHAPACDQRNVTCVRPSGRSMIGWVGSTASPA